MMGRLLLLQALQLQRYLRILFLLQILNMFLFTTGYRSNVSLWNSCRIRRSLKAFPSLLAAAPSPSLHSSHHSTESKACKEKPGVIFVLGGKRVFFAALSCDLRLCRTWCREGHSVRVNLQGVRDRSSISRRTSSPREIIWLRERQADRCLSEGRAHRARVLLSVSLTARDRETRTTTISDRRFSEELRQSSRLDGHDV